MTDAARTPDRVVDSDWLDQYRQSCDRDPGMLTSDFLPGLPVDEGDSRSTDPMLFMALSDRFGGFTMDVAAAEGNAKCPRFFDRRANGLEQPWVGERVWCNPPYSQVRLWVEKAWVESSICPLIVMLLPANRCEQAWWHDLVEPYRDRPGSVLRVEFLPGRPRFLLPGQVTIAAHERPPFGVCLLVWRPLRPEAPVTLFP